MHNSKIFIKDIGEYFQNLELGKEFLNLTPKAYPLKEKLINWTSPKLNTFVL